MEAIVSDLTKKPFKNWKNLFQLFLDQPALSLAQQRDDGLSCFLMGLYHEYGFGFKRDYDAALDYFRLGANKRDPLCLYKLYEIHSGKNFYGIEVDHDIALLYLVWAVTYMFPIYGSYMCLDLDLELQAYYKHTLKMDKEHVFRIIDEYEDDIFGHDKELIKCVFGFLIEFICPKPGFETQVEYQKMIDELANIAEKGDSRFAALFLFKCVIWDFKGVTDKNHKKISSLIRRKKCVSFIFQQLQTVFDYVTLLNKKHTIFSRLLHFHSIEIFLQIKYNCDTDDIPNKTESCEYIVNLLYNSLGILENSFTRSMAIQFMAKSYMSETSARVDLSHALSVIESSRQLPGFVEQDFPFVLGGRLYSKLGKNMMSEQYFEKYMSYSESKPNLSVTFYEQGKYYQFHKRDNEKALEAYIKGLSLSKNVNTFMQECYARKCRDKIVKLIGSNEGLYKKFLPSLENDVSYLSLNNAI